MCMADTLRDVHTACRWSMNARPVLCRRLAGCASGRLVAVGWPLRNRRRPARFAFALLSWLSAVAGGIAVIGDPDGVSGLPVAGVPSAAVMLDVAVFAGLALRDPSWCLQECSAQPSWGRLNRFPRCHRRESRSC